MSDKTVLDYASPEPAGRAERRRRQRRSGTMGILLGMAWLPSQMLFSPTPRGRVLSLLALVATVTLILIVHREFISRRRRNRF